MIDGLNVGKDDNLPAVVATPTHRTPTETPTYEPPELDRTELEANLAKLSPRTSSSSTTTCTPRATTDSARAPGSSPRR